LISLHCNGGCRLESVPKVNNLLDYGFNVVSFDFSGSGMSEGEYVSLGFYEAMDVDVVVNYIKM